MQNILDTPDALRLPWLLEIKMEDGRVLQRSAALVAALAKDWPATTAYVGGFIAEVGKLGAVKAAVFTIFNPQCAPMGRWQYTDTDWGPRLVDID